MELRCINYIATSIRVQLGPPIHGVHGGCSTASYPAAATAYGALSWSEFSFIAIHLILICNENPNNNSNYQISQSIQE